MAGEIVEPARKLHSCLWQQDREWGAGVDVGEFQTRPKPNQYQTIVSEDVRAANRCVPAIVEAGT